MLSVFGDSESPEHPRLRLFFRSALFPLLVIAALAWLALGTLRDSEDSREVAYSDLIARVESAPESIELVTFVPRRQRIDVRLTNGETLESHYPTEASQLEFQHLLQEKRVRFESKGTGSAAWWTLLTTLLPFVLLVGFWIFIMNSRQQRRRSRRRVQPRGEDPSDEQNRPW